MTEETKLIIELIKIFEITDVDFLGFSITWTTPWTIVPVGIITPLSDSTSSENSAKNSSPSTV